MSKKESVAAELMLRVASGDSAAFDQIYDDFAPMVLLRLRRRCRDLDVAAEVLQDTFLKVWRSGSSYAGRGEVGAWIWTIASRSLIDRMRRDGVRPRLVLVSEPPTALAGPSAEDVVLADLGITAAIEQMSPELRAVLQATVVDGLSARDAALLLGVPEGTVKTRARRAQSILREALA